VLAGEHASRLPRASVRGAICPMPRAPSVQAPTRH
jgi:hypothetical protein